MADKTQPGDVLRLTTTITDLDGNPGDPTGLTFTINQPSGAAVAYVYGNDPELVKDGEGIFYVDWPVSEAGIHYFQWKAEGTNASVAEDVFVSQRQTVTAP